MANGLPFGPGGPVGSPVGMPPMMASSPMMAPTAGAQGGPPTADMFAMLSALAKPRKNVVASDLIKEAIPLLEDAADMDKRLAPVIGRAISVLRSGDKNGGHSSERIRSPVNKSKSGESKGAY